MIAVCAKVGRLRLEVYRHAAGLSVAAAAQKFGCTEQEWRRLEKGQAGITHDQAVRLAAVVGREVEELVDAYGRPRLRVGFYGFDSELIAAERSKSFRHQVDAEPPSLVSVLRRERLARGPMILRHLTAEAGLSKQDYFEIEEMGLTTTEPVCAALARTLGRPVGELFSITGMALPVGHVDRASRESATVSTGTVARSERVECRDGKLRPATLPTAAELKARGQRIAVAKAAGKTIDEIAADEGVSRRTVLSDLARGRS